MNFLKKTADVTASYVLGPPYAVIKAFATLPRRQAIKQLAIDMVIRPAIDTATLSIPPIRSTISAFGQCIGSGAQTITTLWISHSVGGAMHHSLQKLAPHTSKQDKQRLQTAMMKQLHPLVISDSAHTMQRIAERFGVNVLAGTVCASVEDRVLSKISGSSIATLKETGLNAVLASGIYTIVDQIQGYIQDEPYSDWKKQQLKEKLRNELLLAAQEDPSIPENLRDSLLSVVHSVAETIVENPLTNLPKLEELLKTKSDLRKGFFARLLQAVIAFLQNLHAKISTRNLDVPTK